jgi:hypothetical protein
LKALWEASRVRDTDEDISTNGCCFPTKRQCVQDLHLCHEGRIVSSSIDWKTLQHQSKSSESHPLYVSWKLPILGGIDRQNRVGSKFGGGGVSSSQQAERERKGKNVSNNWPWNRLIWPRILI